MTEEKHATSLDSDTQQFLTFILGNEHYGVDIMCVTEIRSWMETTRLPNTADYILGVINLRGVVVPIIDMNKRFGMSPLVPTSQSVVIVIHTNERMLGMLVDSVSGILNVNASDMKAAPPTSYMVDDAFITGLVGLKEQMVVLLDVNKMFNGPLMQPGKAVSDRKLSVGEV